MWQNSCSDFCASRIVTVIRAVKARVPGFSDPESSSAHHPMRMDVAVPGTPLELPQAPTHLLDLLLGLLSPSPPSCLQPWPWHAPALTFPPAKAFHISVFPALSHLMSTWLCSACLLTSAGVLPSTAALPVANNLHGCCQIFHSELPTFPGCPSLPLGLS